MKTIAEQLTWNLDFRKDSEELIRQYWWLGTRYLRLKRAGWIKGKYGSGCVKELAKEIGVHRVTFYEAIRFAKYFPDYDELEAFIGYLREQGKVDWQAIRRATRGKNLHKIREWKSSQRNKAVW